MHNKIINLALVAQVAVGLKELRDRMVFIGGAVISLYTDDPAADEIRPTADIDMTAQSGENGHPFRRKADSDSGIKRTPIPVQNGQ